MDIQGTIISAKVVIESLIKILENENVDISSIEFTISNTENGSESESLSFQNLVEITMEELDQVKAQKVAVPEGFALVPVKEIKTWYLDECESIYREDPDWLCDIPTGEVVEVERRISYELDQEPVFVAITWDEDSQDVGYYETFADKDEAEKAAAHCKAMIEAQEQA